MIAPDFVPSSLPPALRMRFFAQHLPEFGWEPIVLAVNPKQYSHPVDEENERLIDPGLRVIRVPALPARVASTFGVGDLGLRSLGHIWRALDRLCREEQPDLMFLSIPPAFDSLALPLVKARYGLPYVLDYIDPWVSDYYRTIPRSRRPGGWKWAVSYHVSAAAERQVVQRAAYLTAVSSGTTDGVVRRYSSLRGIGTAEIPYGGELQDFEYLRRHPRPNSLFDPYDGFLHVSYLGTFSEGQRPVARALFGALAEGRNRRPDLFGRVRMHFAGTTYSAHAEGEYRVLPVARDMGVGDLVTEHPPRLSYLDASQALLDSQALVVLGNEEPHYSASKIFPYIMAARPLLAIFHRKSNVVDIMRETEAGRVVTFDNTHPAGNHIGEIADALQAMLTDIDGFHASTRWDAFERYTARAMTQRLAAVFDQVVPRHGVVTRPAPKKRFGV